MKEGEGTQVAGPESFTGWVAERYDALHDPGDTDAAVEALAALAGRGPVLEFAVGTGRLALPLAARGLDVQGIERSRDMIAQLRAKPGGADLPVTEGDMAHTRVPGQFALVVLAYNTLANLTTQEAQVACFENAAAHLAPGGRFVVELFVPPLQGLPEGEVHRVFAWTDDHWGVDEIDTATQSLISHHIWRDGDAARRLAVPMRYAWPAELDLMARLAGLRLVRRQADWAGAPFTARSAAHVSVWEKPIDAIAPRG